jgi:hypothetical protein
LTLADAHATTGGINEQFLAALRHAGVFETVERSLDQIASRLQQHQHNEPQPNLSAGPPTDHEANQPHRHTP